MYMCMYRIYPNIFKLFYFSYTKVTAPQTRLFLGNIDTIISFTLSKKMTVKIQNVILFPFLFICNQYLINFTNLVDSK